MVGFVRTAIVFICVASSVFAQSDDTSPNNCPYACQISERYTEGCGWLNWSRCTKYRMKTSICYKPCATTATPSTTTTECTEYPCLMFHDNFDTLDFKVWEHELTAGGGGNWEFQFYTNNRTNTYVRDGVLYIKPTLTVDQFGEAFLTSGKLELWGAGPHDTCTGNAFYGCERVGNHQYIINPIQSARLRSSRGLNFKYGKVEISAQLPKGDWLWPAIWMLPTYTEYGGWPASGEIDIMESRGNRHYYDANGRSVGVDSYGSTIHFGTDYFHNGWSRAHQSWVKENGTYGDEFHTYGVEWDEDAITFSFDGRQTLRVSPGDTGFWGFGEFNETGFDNPWKGASKMAPFDKEFYIILNVAVGGFNYFDDSYNNTVYPKPWTDATASQFWAAKDQWYPTWNPDVRGGEDAALKIDSVKVWKFQ
ncbi:beta-1,3-glucan-binding protein-like [Haliotis cracherodii]|uniref:beta-1,3-glucan-binding protein-like n=1 Tax=Haliotis cracherodii TaxID=6455 RepID=UPI0039EB1043